MDDVHCEMVRALLKFYNQKYQKQVLFEDIKSYNLWESGVGETREEAVKIVREFYSSPDFEKIRWMNGAASALKQLAFVGDILIITSRAQETETRTRNFYSVKLPRIHFDFYFSDGFFNTKKTSKAEICRKKGIELMFEDNAQTAFECAEAGALTFLFKKSWNRDYKSHRNLTYVSNWGEVMCELKKLGVIR